MAEVTIEDETVVQAPAAEVWEAIIDPARHAAWHPFVVKIDGEHRLGAERRCQVLVGKKSGETTERCISHERERELVWIIEHDSTGFSRMAADWRAGFTLEARDGTTAVRARSALRAKNPLVRLMLPVIRRKFHQTQRAILAALKESVEEEHGEQFSPRPVS